jgi:hypothetical protein
MAEPREELLDVLKERPTDVLTVVGSGVSVATSGRYRCADWYGLLNHGINYVHERGLVAPTWTELRRKQLEETEFISVADMITEVLGGHTDGAFAEWFLQCYDACPVKDQRIIESLRDLRCGRSTTNYDKLIETVLGCDSCTWQDQHLLSWVMRGTGRRRVLHIHGVYDQPDSLIWA